MPNPAEFLLTKSLKEIKWRDEDSSPQVTSTCGLHFPQILPFMYFQPFIRLPSGSELFRKSKCKCISLRNVLLCHNDLTQPSPTHVVKQMRKARRSLCCCLCSSHPSQELRPLIPYFRGYQSKSWHFIPKHPLFLT